jgi:hypothetical protein
MIFQLIFVYRPWSGPCLNTEGLSNSLTADPLVRLSLKSGMGSMSR